MLATRPLGQGAASKKYDVITALGAYACADNKFQQKLILRFITLITARYNWQRDELSMGRADIARLWKVNERTVKRELAKLKTAGWLMIKRPSARGRVTVYSIDWTQVLGATQECWKNVGPDFEQRMCGQDIPDRPEPDRTVVQFPSPSGGETDWDRALLILHRENPMLHANWLAAVRVTGQSGGVLELEAPTAFHAQYLNTHAMDHLRRAVSRVTASVHRIVIHHG